ncbi:hypothetical protein V8C86DRAFT_2753054 [Haematococcus lacustris]
MGWGRLLAIGAAGGGARSVTWSVTGSGAGVGAWTGMGRGAGLHNHPHPSPPPQPPHTYLPRVTLLSCWQRIMLQGPSQRLSLAPCPTLTHLGPPSLMLLGHTPAHQVTLILGQVSRWWSREVGAGGQGIKGPHAC